jgi:hypothetical protein
MRGLLPVARKRPWLLRAMSGAIGVLVFAATVSGLEAPSATAAPSSGIVFDGSPGTGAPPSTLGPYTMQAFGPDSQSIGADVSGVTGPTGTITFDPQLEHDQVGNGWATWSNGYSGDVYATGEAETVTVGLPAGTSAFYLYAEPDEFATFTVTATAQDGTSSGPVNVNGEAGAAYFGFYATGSTTISSITVTTAGDDFAIGEFGIASSTEVAAVRFAPVSSQTDPKAPGLPVVKDDGSTPVMDHQWGPTSCPDGLADPQSYDYLDCTSPPSGMPSKDWPVIYVAGSALTINQAVFFSQTDMTGAQLTATAAIGGQTLTLPSTALTSTQVNGAYELSASNLTFQGTLPAQPGVDTLTITWTVSSGGGSTVIGVSKHQLYVTAAPYAQPQGTPDANVLPYVSLLDVGTKAAAGQTSPRAVFNAIWTKFATRDIAHPILDPATGMTSNGPDLDYYTNGYTTIPDWWLKPFGLCPSFPAFLADDSGHCGNWAEMLAYVLAYQGISSKVVDVGESGFYLGPKPDVFFPAEGFAYMLIDPKLWSFSSPTATGAYPYEDPITVSGGTINITGSEIVYQPSSTPIAQGEISTPPEMFATGDHAIVEVPQWGYVDPSYGNPSGTTPYSSLVGDYEPTAVAGFAAIFYRVANMWVPMPVTDATGIISTCSKTQCEFRATPYSPPKP